MRIYCPHKCWCWGDWIGNFWAAEYIKTHLLDAVICIDDYSPSGYRMRTVDSNISEWTDEFIDSTQPCKPEYDYILCTHHRHGVYVQYDEPYKKIYFDIHGMNLKFILENWYPSFCPTKTLIKQFEKLNLPNEYNVVHYSYDRNNTRRGNNPTGIYGMRNKYSFEDFLKIYEWIWKDNKNVISTGKPLPQCRDLTKITALLKLYVMLKAKKIYVSLSGFTAIASMWRKRKHSYLIDANTSVVKNGVTPYTNIKITGDLKPIYYYLENHSFPKYYDWCLTAGVIEQPNARHGGWHPDFEVTKDESPPDYIPKKVYMDIENCPLPFNYKIEYEEI